jgi:two-component system cell cycle sensor histidine kinase/response regulator CckA
VKQNTADTVLVVNDNTDQLDLTQFILEQAGYRVLRAEHGAEGLEIATKKSPDLVVSDVMMPVMDGIEMCRRIRENPDLHRVPVLLLSALRVDSKSAVEGFHAGADDYLEVPFEQTRFIAKIARLFERKRDEEAHIKLIQTQNALRESEERYRILFDNNPFPMWVTDVKTLRFLAINDAALKHYGYSKEEFLSMTIADIRPPEDVPALLKSLSETRSRKFQAKLWQHIKKDGTVIDVEITSHDLVFDGKPSRLILTNDVTERRWAEITLRQIEEQLRQSQKLESVGRLAGGIAHDFNNMLTAINGYSDLILRRLPPNDPLRRNIEEIKKAGERSAELTHQLLAFSRRQILQTKVLDLNKVISDTIIMFQRLIGEDIQLVASLSPEIGNIEADPGQLSQVILNLVINARDAMPQGGSIVIETERVQLDDRYAGHHISVKPGDYVMLAVSDTGIGMDEETKKQIFEPFFTTKEIGKGTGLGLSTVYGIIKQSGGNIWVYSEPGKGSTFKIYLPRIAETTKVSEKSSQSTDSHKGSETILLVEDETIVRKLSREVLESCGYKVIEAEHGVDALEICEKYEGKIDLLMTDVVMPKMGGRELAEILTKNYPHISVLFTSGYTDDAVILHGIIDVGTNFIQRPFTFDILARKVRELLDKSADA